MSTTSSKPQRKGLDEFNAKLNAIRSGGSGSIQPEHFPDFSLIDRQAKLDLEQRRRDAEARNRAEVDKSHVPKTAAEYRGAGAVPLPHKVKTESTDTSQLSVAALGNNPVHNKKTLGKMTCDICHVESNLRVSGHGSLFAKEKLTTSRGWSHGQF
jgi:hypothetical protein